MDQPLMTTKEVAQYLGVHLITVYRQLNANKLPGFKIGGSWRIRKSALDDFLNKKTISCEAKE